MTANAGLCQYSNTYVVSVNKWDTIQNTQNVSLKDILRHDDEMFTIDEHIYS